MVDKRDNEKRDEHKKLSVDQRVKYTTDTDYTLQFSFSTRGNIEKNDLMGAIYNHGTNLIEELTLEQLQNKRRLGRFEIELIKDGSGNTTGELSIPIKGDAIDASIIGANIESISKCGPYVINVKLNRIVNDKVHIRTKLLEAAQKIYHTKFSSELTDVKALRDVLKVEVNKVKYVTLNAEHQIYGGPYYNNKEIYLVEGVGDIKVLMNYGIYNTISVNGANNNPEILSTFLTGKEVTALFDNDRGGKLLLEQILKDLPISYYVLIPENTSVETIPKPDLFASIYNNRKLCNS
jgi:5S rRNA maturation endonuclease (ribonuclease M5)